MQRYAHSSLDPSTDKKVLVMYSVMPESSSDTLYPNDGGARLESCRYDGYFKDGEGQATNDA
jgi:hypothetical protein